MRRAGLPGNHLLSLHEGGVSRSHAPATREVVSHTRLSAATETRPTWSQISEIPLVCLDRLNLSRCIAVALVVGTILFFINQADVVFGGQATAATWLKVGLTYLVPFFVSQYGLLLGSRRSGK